MTIETAIKPELWAVMNAPTPSNRLYPVSNEAKAKELGAFYEKPVIPFVREIHCRNAIAHVVKRAEKAEERSQSMLLFVVAVMSGEPVSQRDFDWLVSDCGSRCLDCMIVTNFMMVTPEGTKYDDMAAKLGLRLAYEDLGEVEEASDMTQEEFIVWLDTHHAVSAQGWAQQGYTFAGVYMSEDGDVTRLWATRVGGVEA